MEEFKVLRAVRKVHSILTALDLKITDLGLFRNLFGKLPWDKDPGRREGQEIWSMFKDHFQAQ